MSKFQTYFSDRCIQSSTLWTVTRSVLFRVDSIIGMTAGFTVKKCLINFCHFDLKFTSNLFDFCTSNCSLLSASKDNVILNFKALTGNKYFITMKESIY